MGPSAVIDTLSHTTLVIVDDQRHPSRDPGIDGVRPADPAPPSPRRSAAGLPSFTRVRRVLVAEPHAPTARRLASRLRALGLEPSRVADFDNVTALIATDPPDVVLLSLAWPRLEAAAVLAHLAQRREPRCPSKIIALVHPTDAERIEAAAARVGVFDLLRKPIQPAELEACLRLADAWVDLVTKPAATSRRAPRTKRSSATAVRAEWPSLAHSDPPHAPSR